MYIRRPMHASKAPRLRVAAVLLWVAAAAVLLSSSTASFAGSASAHPDFALPLGPVGAAPRALPVLDPPSPPAVVATVNVGSEPVNAVTDLANGLVYVANTISNNVSVLDGRSLVATIGMTANETAAPVYLAYDNLTGFVFVVDRYNFEATVGAVNVVNGTSIIATLSVGTLPDSAVFDWLNGDLYVTNSASSNVTVIHGTAVVATVPVGAGPDSAAFDPFNGYVYVANGVSGNVSVLSGTSVVGSVPVGTGPVSVAYDYDVTDACPCVYVVNNGSANVTVLDGLSAVGNVPVGAGPSFVAANPSVAGLEVANTNSSNLTVVNGTSPVATVPVGAGPVWLGLGPSENVTFVADRIGNSVSLLSGMSSLGTVPVGSLPVWGAADPLNGLEYIVNSGSNNVSIFGVTYPVTFNETGLAGGVNWAVTLGGTTGASTSPSIAFAEPSGEYAYSVATPSGYALVASVPASPLNVTTHSVTVAVTFAAVPSTNYTLTFAETGLECSSHRGGHVPSEWHRCCRSSPIPAWSVTVDGLTKSTTNTTVAFSEPNGSHVYTIGAPPGYSVSSAVPASPVTIAGANLTVNVTFAAIRSTNYTLAFVETGLGCSSHRGHDPSSNPIMCCRSSTPAWNVTVNGLTESTTNNSLTFWEPNGTYNYTVGTPSGYNLTSAVPSSPVTIAGAGLTVNLTFSPTGPAKEFSVTFEETGLPNGTTWCVTLGVLECSAGAEIVFSGLAPGSYAFNVSAVGGYTPSPGYGTVRLSYQNVTVQVRFSTQHSCMG